jgi:hypothetical protein
MLANVGDAGISEPTGQNLTGINQWKYFQTLEKYCSDGDLFLETLLQFLENAPAIDYPDWTDSDAQKAARGLIINSSATLANYAAVAQSRRAFLLLRPFIQRCELQYIRPMLGVAMFDSLKASILDGTLSTDQKILIDQYLSPLLVSYTFKDALHKLAFQFSGIGVRFLSDSDAVKQRLAADPTVVGLMKPKGFLKQTLFFIQIINIHFLKQFYLLQTNHLTTHSHLHLVFKYASNQNSLVNVLAYVWL